MKIVRALVVVGALAFTAACGTSQTSDAESSREEGAKSGLNVVDAMFVQMMLPHHEQAILMADMALETSRGASAEVVDLARQIKEAQEAEMLILRELLATADDTLDGHMHDMKGMLTDDEIEELAGSSGAEFDTLWLTGMIAHHEGAVEMAKDVLRDGADQRVRDLAEGIAAVQRAERALMKTLVG